MRVLQDPADAEEVVVDVYRQVWDEAMRYDARRGTAVAWLVILARSRAMDRRRSRVGKLRTEVQVPQVPVVICKEAGPEDAALANETRRSVSRALAALPDEQRQAIELAFFPA